MQLLFFKTNNCDLLVIDLMLTDIDGVGVLEKVREVNKNAYQKVVCITSFTSPLISNALEKLNVSYCFKIPFDLTILAIVSLIPNMSKNDLAFSTSLNSG